MKWTLFVITICLISSCVYAQSVQDITWTNAVNVAVNGNSMTKTGGGTDWNGGAFSTQFIPANMNGYVEMVAQETGTNRMFGLSEKDQNQNYTTIGYAVYLIPDTRIQVYENGNCPGNFGSYATGNVLRVAREGNQVKYYCNGSLLYTSTINTTARLYADTSLDEVNSTIHKATIGVWFPAKIGQLEYSDEESPESWGNGDRTIQTFEAVLIRGEILGETALNVQDWSVEPELPADVALVQPSEIVATQDAKKLQFRLNVMAGKRYGQARLSFPIYLKYGGMKCSSATFEAPFVKVNLSKRWLERKIPLQTKDFDYKSKQELDEFLLQKYPNSEYAPALFRFRLEYCRRFRDQKLHEIENIQYKEVRERSLIEAINEYHEFIEKYPDRLLTRIAIQDCFELYTKVNRISLYYNFIQRYPNAEQSHVAQEYIQALLFALACTENTIQGYDRWLALFPEDSFYRNKCIELAFQKNVQEEESLWKRPADKEEKTDTLKELLRRNERQDRASTLVQMLYEIREEYEKILANERAQKAAGDLRSSRIQKVIRKTYSDTHAMSVILIWNQLPDIIALNQAVQEHIAAQKKRLQENYEKYCTTLEQTMTANFQEIYKSLEKDGKLDKNGAEQLQKNLAQLASCVQNLQKNGPILSVNPQKIQDKGEQQTGMIDINLTASFSRVNKEIDGGFQMILSRLQALLRDLRAIRQATIQLDIGIVAMSQYDRDFLFKSTTLCEQLQGDGKLYTGYNAFPKSGTPVPLFGNIEEIQKMMQKLPKTGPIPTEKISIPACTLLGDKMSETAGILWEEIF